MIRRLGLILGLALLVVHAKAQSVVHDVIYEKKGGCAFTMDVFKPAQPNGAGIIWIVSGGWFSSHEAIDPNLASALNAKGYTVFEVVHGSQPKFIIPEILDQLTHAIRFIHANATTYGVDGKRLGLAGGSAGGHLSLMLAGSGDQGDPNANNPVDKAPSTVAAVVAYFPPTDFLNWGGEGKTPFHRPELAIFMPAFGVNAQTPESTLTELARKLSPIYKVTPAFPPTLLIHGDKDPLVPIQQSQIMDAALEKAGVKHKFVTVPGGVHGGKTVTEGAAAFFDWFDTYLK